MSETQPKDEWKHHKDQEVFTQEHHLDQLIGRRLIKLREQAMMTAEDLAVLACLPLATIQEHETAQIPVPLSRMPKIAQALRLSTQELVSKLLYPGC